jgi:hypothetical protein
LFKERYPLLLLACDVVVKRLASLPLELQKRSQALKAQIVSATVQIGAGAPELRSELGSLGPKGPWEVKVQCHAAPPLPRRAVFRTRWDQSKRPHDSHGSAIEPEATLDRYAVGKSAPQTHAPSTTGKILPLWWASVLPRDSAVIISVNFLSANSLLTTWSGFCYAISQAALFSV